jgi:hypothetical protein
VDTRAAVERIVGAELRAGAAEDPADGAVGRVAGQGGGGAPVGWGGVALGALVGNGVRDFMAGAAIYHIMLRWEDFEIYNIEHHNHRDTVGDGSAVPTTTIFFRNLSLRLSSLDLTPAARLAFCIASWICRVPF